MPASFARKYSSFPEHLLIMVYNIDSIQVFGTCGLTIQLLTGKEKDAGILLNPRGASTEA